MNLQDKNVLLMSGKQAASALNISYQTFLLLVRRGAIRPVEGFKSKRKFSEHEIIRYAYNLAKDGGWIEKK